MLCSSSLQTLDTPVRVFSLYRINNTQKGRSSKVRSEGFSCFLNVKRSEGRRSETGGCSPSSSHLLHKALPLVASVSILLWSIPGTNLQGPVCFTELCRIGQEHVTFGSIWHDKALNAPIDNSTCVTSNLILNNRSESSGSANAGLLSGFAGIESIPGPQLPEIDFLKRLNEENQKKYTEFDSRFKSSPLLKQLLEKSKLNKERNRQQILDKYCERGAEWGVGDCSTEGMKPDEREAFIKILKEKSTAR